jgi:hypothetical protein
VLVEITLVDASDVDLSSLQSTTPTTCDQ